MIAYQVKVTDLLHLLLSDQEAFFVHEYKSLRRQHGVVMYSIHASKAKLLGKKNAEAIIQPVQLAVIRQNAYVFRWNHNESFRYAFQLYFYRWTVQCLSHFVLW